MQDSMNQFIPLSKQLNGLNNKLVSQITCERKSHADLNAKQLKEIKSLKSEINLKDSEITSLENKGVLRSEVSDLERKAERDELDQFASQSHQISHDSKIENPSSSDYKHSETVEEIPHFSSHCSEREPNGKGDCNSILAVPIIALGGSNPD
ncbi:9796_t:CDS:2, partial [Funneliformis caledonium]